MCVTYDKTNDIRIARVKGLAYRSAVYNVYTPLQTSTIRLWFFRLTLLPLLLLLNDTENVSLWHRACHRPIPLPPMLGYILLHWPAWLLTRSLRWIMKDLDYELPSHAPHQHFCSDSRLRTPRDPGLRESCFHDLPHLGSCSSDTWCGVSLSLFRHMTKWERSRKCGQLW